MSHNASNVDKKEDDIVEYQKLARLPKLVLEYAHIQLVDPRGSNFVQKSFCTSIMIQDAGEPDWSSGKVKLAETRLGSVRLKGAIAFTKYEK